MKNKKIKIIIASFCFTSIVCAALLLRNMSTVEKSKVSDKKLKTLYLNHIAVSANDFNIKNIKFSNKAKNKLKKQVDIYKVTAKKYSEKDITKTLKKSLNINVVDSRVQDGVKVYELSNGGDLTYYDKSGSLSYNLPDYEEVNSKKEFSEEKLREIAETFIKKTQLWSTKDLEFVRANPSRMIETSKGKSIQSYEVIYSKSAPSNIEGYEGTGPGILVEIDSTGKIIGFISIKKEIELCETQYPGKRVDNIKDDIIDSNNVMIYTNEELGENINIDNIEPVLYSDGIDQEQEYMVTHYRCENSNEKTDIVLPAIDDSYIKIKKND